MLAAPASSMTKSVSCHVLGTRGCHHNTQVTSMWAFDTVAVQALLVLLCTPALLVLMQLVQQGGYLFL